MQLNQLQFLLALSREGSYQKAAKRMNVSQSTVSMAVKNLEDELDYQILQRSNRGLIFTEKGKQVLEHATAIESDLRELQNLKNTFLDEMAGKVFIAGASHGYNLQLVDLIIHLQEQYPRLQICLEDYNNLEIIHRVAQGNYLMGFLQLNSIDEVYYQNEIEQHNLEFFQVDTGKMCFAVGAHHPYYNCTNCSLEDFLQSSIIISRYQMSEIFLNYFKEKGYKERIVILHDVYSSRHLVENSSFYAAFFPEFGTYYDNALYNQNLKVMPIKDFSCGYKSGWVYRKTGYSLREERVRQLLLKSWSDLQKGGII